eukprot:TRINITY_DN1285_c0_g1_i1.p1 TRINITY_DN1285_c0_g1~~TRINITY_DN1285_c0_g1_i1.p1  ORF type:complete len:393 (+),score=97.56 TRINITY_DN1285_c0_g1_i1:32-1180(+)
MKFLLTILLLTLFITVNCEYFLKTLVLVSRHADRSPLGNYIAGKEYNYEWDCDLTNFFSVHSNDHQSTRRLARVWDKNEQYLAGTCFMGQLTSVGANQHSKLGSNLRQKYGLFLPMQYNSRDVNVHASMVERTQVSAYFSLLSLFPDDPEETIDIHIKDSLVDYVDPWSFSKNCPKFQKTYNEIKNGKEYMSLEQHLTDKYKAFLKDLYDIDVSLETDFVTLADFWRCVEAHGFDFPKKITNEILTDIWNVTTKQINLFSENDTTLRLSIGRLFGHIIDRLDNVINGEEKYKFTFYSGHDSTIQPMRSVLQMNNDEWPPYASHFVFELHENSDDNLYYVRVFFQDNVVKVPECGNVDFCEYTKFKSFIQKFVPDITTECKIN